MARPVMSVMPLTATKLFRRRDMTLGASCVALHCGKQSVFPQLDTSKSVTDLPTGACFFNCASLCGDKSPLGAFDDHRCFPVLPLRCDSPTLGCHRHPVGRVERVGGGHTFPEIDSRQRPAIRRDPIILADQTRDSLVVLGRRIDVSISWPLDVPAGSLYVHITVCIVRLQRSNNFTLARSLGVVSCQPPRRSNYLVRQS